MRRYIADTFALIVFSTVGGALVELFIAGLSVEQTVKTRLGAIPVMLFAGRPYGIYRDWLFRLFGANEGGQVKAAITDTFANVSFQVPVYSCLLALNGASLTQIAAAVSSVIVLIIVSGRPYGLFLVWCRKLFRVPGIA